MEVQEMQTLRGFPSQHSIHPLATRAQSQTKFSCFCLLPIYFLSKSLLKSIVMGIFGEFLLVG